MRDSEVGVEDPTSGPHACAASTLPTEPAPQPHHAALQSSCPPKGSHLPCIVDNAEVGSVFQLPWLLKLGVGTLLLNQFFNKSFIRGFGEPAFFIQESQHTRRIGLITKGRGD